VTKTTNAIYEENHHHHPFNISLKISAQTNYVQNAKTIIGREKMGHTYAGAKVPFGAVQLSLDTDTIP
jgi:hypothetical protein